MPRSNSTLFPQSNDLTGRRYGTVNNYEISHANNRTMAALEASMNIALLLGNKQSREASFKALVEQYKTLVTL